MKMRYMEWIEKYNLNFQLFINENENVPIYKSVDQKIETGKLNEFNKGIVDVLETKKINNKFFLKINYKNKTLGWCSPNNSIQLFRTKKTSIKINKNMIIPEQINEFVGIDVKRLNDNTDKMFNTDLYALFNNKIYVGVTLKNELLGFVDYKYISFFQEAYDEFILKGENVTLYKDSNLEKILVEKFLNKNQKNTLLGVFTEFKTARIIAGEHRCWVSTADIDLHFNTNDYTLEEIVLDALFFQLKDKLEKQIVFSDKKIKYLNKKINSFEIQEF